MDEEDPETITSVIELVAHMQRYDLEEISRDVLEEMLSVDDRKYLLRRKYERDLIELEN